MAFQPINLGTRGNNQTGDDINIGGDKINDNFQELYTTKLEGITGGTGITIDNTDPLNPVINGSSLVTTTSDLTNDGSDGTSTFVENDELGSLALLDTVGTSEIDDSSITLAKMSNATAFSILGNNTGSAATPTYLTTTQIRTLLNIEDGATADQTLSIVGDQLTISGAGGNTITIPTGGGGVVVDNVITDGSNNPVTNNAIHDALVNINAFVATGNIQADKIQDGSGSGLDADLFNGLGISEFVRIDTLTANDGQLTINSDDTFAKGLRLRNNTTGQSSFFWIDNSNRLNIDNASNAIRDVHINRSGSGQLRVNDNLVWHAGNDGAGSGLNADLLDGFNGSQFLRSDVDDTTTGKLTVQTARSGNFATQISNTDTGASSNGLRVDVVNNSSQNTVQRWYVNGTEIARMQADSKFIMNGSGSVIVPDEAYGSGWNGSTEVPTKNAVYDKIESLGFPTYATGNFTPTFIDAGGGATYSTSSVIGEYTRIGNLVTLTIFANINSTTGTATGEFRIGGLPSFGGSGTAYSGVGTVEMNGIAMVGPNAATGVEILNSHVVANNSANGYITLNRDIQGIGVMQPMEDVFWSSGQITITITCTL